MFAHVTFKFVGSLHVVIKIVLPEADKLAAVALEFLEEDAALVDTLGVVIQVVPCHGGEIALVTSEAEDLITSLW